MTRVPEQDVEMGIRLLAETEGIFTETAGGVTIAGLERLVRNRSIDPNDETVAVITGIGLKTLEVMSQRDAIDVLPARTQDALDALERS